MSHITGKVKTYNDYVSIILDWFPIRKQLYKTRLDKQEYKLSAEIAFEQHIVRYIKLNEKLKISQMKDEESMVAALTKHKFPKYNTGPIRNNTYMSIEELKVAIHEDASHDYLLNLRCRDLVLSAVTKREEHIQKLQSSLAEVKKLLSEPIPGQSLWIRDLEALREV